ncbi:hypothetical protein [Rhizobium terrae]|uniref:hypothetical protein n=1 Tax=Rhizobium terrae TaxID=2171756 RepID=UPI000E3C0878|nr:hypothetical protein [Rhizobium terrae]
MAILTTAAAVIAVLGAVPNLPGINVSDIAERLDCTSAVRQVVQETGGRLLSVRSHGGQCVINILVQRANERPRKIIIRADPRQERMAGDSPAAPGYWRAEAG